MASRERAGRAAPRKRLSRERVLHAAMKIVDKGGIDAISMRKLAQSLGVEAMSLYNHVADKDDVLGGIVELVATEIETHPDNSDWKMAMRGRLLSAHRLLAQHPWAAALWMTRGSFGTGRLRFADSILGGLRKAGFSDELIYHGYHVLQSHLLGYTLAEANFQFDPKQLAREAEKFLQEFAIQDYPDMAEHVRQHLHPPEGLQATFEFGLDLILESLERRLD